MNFCKRNHVTFFCGHKIWRPVSQMYILKFKVRKTLQNSIYFLKIFHKNQRINSAIIFMIFLKFLWVLPKFFAFTAALDSMNVLFPMAFCRSHEKSMSAAFSGLEHPLMLKYYKWLEDPEENVHVIHLPESLGFWIRYDEFRWPAIMKLAFIFAENAVICWKHFNYKPEDFQFLTRNFIIDAAFSLLCFTKFS